MLTKSSLSHLPHRGEVSSDRQTDFSAQSALTVLLAELLWCGAYFKKNKLHSLLLLVVCLSPGAGCRWVGVTEFSSLLAPAAWPHWPAMPTGMHSQMVLGESRGCAASTAALSTPCSGFGPAAASVLDGFGSAMQKNTRRLSE